jgi:hypothetical protein
MYSQPSKVIHCRRRIRRLVGGMRWEPQPCSWTKDGTNNVFDGGDLLVSAHVMFENDWLYILAFLS